MEASSIESDSPKASMCVDNIKEPARSTFFLTTQKILVVPRCDVTADHVMSAYLQLNLYRPQTASEEVEV